MSQLVFKLDFASKVYGDGIGMLLIVADFCSVCVIGSVT
jgi:hypothetical protein